jgi:hypothetical protein
MGQSPVAGTGEEYPLAAYQLRVGKSVRCAPAADGESLADNWAKKVPGGPLGATPRKNDPGPANFLLNTCVDPFRASVLRVNVN